MVHSFWGSEVRKQGTALLSGLAWVETEEVKEEKGTVEHQRLQNKFLLTSWPTPLLHVGGGWGHSSKDPRACGSWESEVNSCHFCSGSLTGRKVCSSHPARQTGLTDIGDLPRSPQNDHV